jgi:malonyl-CoA O-methyltransferase
LVSRKTRIAAGFAAQAGAYDAVGSMQREVAGRLAARIGARVEGPARVLEIGCGTGFLSAHLTALYPDAAFCFTDIAPEMLARCRDRLGEGHQYLVLDGEQPEAVGGGYDLIASSLAMQWFEDLPGGLARLTRLLASRGRLIFATVGSETFKEWRQAHAALGLESGAPNYPTAAEFPWPEGVAHRLEVELLTQDFANGHDFVRGLKALGAAEPVAGHRPLSAGAFRRLLATLEGGFSVSYEILYGEVWGA